MKEGGGPVIYLSKVHQLQDELKHLGGEVSEDWFTDIILEGLTPEYEPIRFKAIYDEHYEFSDIERTIYANTVHQRVLESVQPEGTGQELGYDGSYPTFNFRGCG